jgi:hypothetical protein
MSVSMLYCHFRVFLVQVTDPTPLLKGRLLAVSPDVTELLAAATAATMRETSLCFVRLYPDLNMGKARHFEYLMGLCRPR